MNMKFLILTMILLAITLALTPLHAGAQLNQGFNRAELIANNIGLSTQTPIAFLKSIINIGLSFIGIIALAILVYGGFLFITSAGDEEKASRAKRLILYAVIGVLLIGASVIIVNMAISVFSPNS